LDDEEDHDLQLLDSRSNRATARSSIAISNQSSHTKHTKPSISFGTEVNLARQKAGAKALLGRQTAQISRYEPPTITSLTAFPRTTFLNSSKPLQVKTTIWTRQDRNHMVKENHLQWWNFCLEDNCMSYNNWFIEHIQNHTGWQERKGGDQIKLDFGRRKPILIGETELKGDPITIPVPQGGGTWYSLLQNIPGFLDELLAEEVPRGSGKRKTTTNSSNNIRCLSIIVPTTAIQQEGLKSDSGWSPKKPIRRVVVKQQHSRVKVETARSLPHSGLLVPSPSLEPIATSIPKLGNPMSIQSLIKPDSTDVTTTPRSFKQQQRQSAYPTISSSSCTTPPKSNTKNTKGLRKRTTSILSPEGITIGRNSLGKRGRMINYLQKLSSQLGTSGMNSIGQEEGLLFS